MSMHQYIGARYVPMFYVNSVDGSTLWESNVRYEPLIWVSTINGHMYLSRKEVPNTVGTPADNPDYWLEVGQFNGYIQTLQDEIDDINDELVPIENMVTSGLVHDDELIFITDSYGVDASAGGTSWLTLMRGVYPDCFYNATSGAGFCTMDSGGHDFLSHLQEVAATITNKDKIKQIIVVGGSNDANRLHAGAISESIITTKMGDFCTYVKNNFPNAVVKVLFCGTQTDVNGTYVKASTQCALTYRSAMASISNGVYNDNAENIMKNRDFVSDSVHPTATGSVQIFYAVSHAVYNTKFTFKYRSTANWQSAPGATDAISVSNFDSNSFVLFDGETCHLSLRGLDYYKTDFTVNMASSGQEITWDKGVEKSLAYITNVPLGPTGATNGDLSDTPVFKIVPCTCIKADNSGTANIPFIFTLRGIKLYAKPIDTSHTVNRIRIPNFTMDIPMFTY